MYTWVRYGAIKPIDATAAEISKAASDTSAPKGWVEGFLTTEAPDEHGDVLLADGFDKDHFLKKGGGAWCYDHPRRAHTRVGRSTEVWVDTHPSGHKGIKTRGYFYLDIPVAKTLYETAMALVKAEEDESHHLAWSVEGKSGRDYVEPREGGRYLIKKSFIHTAAVTDRPANFYARIGDKSAVEIAASLVEADSRGELIPHLEALLEHEKLMKSLAEVASDASYQRHIIKVLERFPHLDVSRAKAVVGRVYELLG